MADVAMEREGKAAGGRVAAAHLELLLFVWCVLLAETWGFREFSIYFQE
jgi:hypothetical protein